jgi:outer membrane protein OmpA-like peptidoglycan-associated protein
MDRIYINIADLMSALMMVFLFIAIAFMLDVQRSKNQIEHQKNAMTEIVEIAEQSRQNLHNDLLKAFTNDLERWDAEILDDNTVRFNADEVLFQRGKSSLQAEFKDILNRFFPRYVTILQSYRADIEAIRIEGHTSSVWANGGDVATRYLGNVKLSQQRALATLKYCYLLPSVKEQRDWLQKVLRANGLSFAKLILNAEGSENTEKSRRVEFKVVTKAEEKLHQILERSQMDEL